MTTQDMIEEMSDVVHQHVIENMIPVYAERIGIDHRSGIVYIDDDYIAVTQHARNNLDYYGGFEYIAKEYIISMGGFVFYSRESDRVDECLTYYESQEN